MKEIKFRAWTREGHRLSDVGEIEFFTDGSYCVNDEIPTSCIEQFTGLLDKNEKPIYEGDIVEFLVQQTSSSEPQEIQAQVRYAEPLAAYVLAYFDSTRADLVSAVGADILEVIGNVHENPEVVEAPDERQAGTRPTNRDSGEVSERG